MSDIPQSVREKFLEKLTEDDQFTKEQVNELRSLMENSTKLKAKDVEAVFKKEDDLTL